MKIKDYFSLNLRFIRVLTVYNDFKLKLSKINFSINSRFIYKIVLLSIMV